MTRESLYDYLTAFAIVCALLVGALAYFDVLTK